MMVPKRKAISPKAGTLMGKTASQLNNHVETTTEFITPPQISLDGAIEELVRETPKDLWEIKL